MTDTRILDVRHYKKRKRGPSGRARDPEHDQRVTHHMSGTKEYRAYWSAKSRCENKKIESYPWYGGRGIKFKFNSFEEFFAAAGFAPSPEHMIDRKDTNGHYELGNIRWATPQEQNQNHGICHYIEIDGERKTMTEWCRIFGVSRSAARSRIRNGWPEHLAVSLPTSRKAYNSK